MKKNVIKKSVKNLNPLLRKKKPKSIRPIKSDRARTRDNPFAEMFASLFDKK